MRQLNSSNSLILILLCTLAFNSFAGDKDRGMHPGKGRFRGNERSERPGRVQVGDAGYSGNGCPSGTMRAVFAPDNLSFTLLFDQFIAQTDVTGNAHRDIMSCNLILPIDIPENMQMEITRVDYRGFVGLPAGSRARLVSVFNFLGKGGDRDRINLHFDFQGPVTDAYEISTDAMNQTGQLAQSEVSPCGGHVGLRVMTRLVLMSRSKTDNASITLDSIDGSSNAVYYVNWKQCTQGQTNADHGRGRGN